MGPSGEGHAPKWKQKQLSRCNPSATGQRPEIVSTARVVSRWLACLPIVAKSNKRRALCDLYEIDPRLVMNRAPKSEARGPSSRNPISPIESGAGGLVDGAEREREREREREEARDGRAKLLRLSRRASEAPNQSADTNRRDLTWKRGHLRALSLSKSGRNLFSNRLPGSGAAANNNNNR